MRALKRPVRSTLLMPRARTGLLMPRALTGLLMPRALTGLLMPRALTGLLMLLALTGCAQQPSALDPYVNATLTAGVGLGDLKLGQTTLGSVVQRLGVETVTPLASEEIGLELFYEHGQLALLFIIEPECMSTLKTGLRPAATDLPAFLARTPCLREARLSSISVRSRTSADESWFQGATDAGARLWDPSQAAYKHGETCGGPVHLVAGLNPNNPPDELHFKTGIAFYYLPIEGGDARQTRIQRITIYPAGQ